MTSGQVADLVRNAFAATPYPGDDALVRSHGDEPAEVAELFRGRTDWTALDPRLIDRAGAASPSALSFFTAGAFRFYLPAYLVADLAGRLQYTGPLFYLYFGVDQSTRSKPVKDQDGNPRTWWDVQQKHFAGFSPTEAAAIIAYLRWKLEEGTITAGERRSVTEALENYWEARAARKP